MLGHGSSKVPPENSSLADFAGQLEELRSSLNIERAHLVGHSMGALIAIEYALTFSKRVLSVAALNAVFMRSPEQRRAVEERAFGLDGLKHDTASNEQAILRWFGDPVPDHLVAYAQLARHALQVVDPMGYRRTYRLFASSDGAHKDRLQDLRPPALFMTGEGDPNSTPEMSLTMSRITPRSSCEILQGERHMMPLTASHAVIERLIRFFETGAEKLSPTYSLGSAQA
jgi:pimeloyl-ACP methyl ester carboxylesterase